MIRTKYNRYLPKSVGVEVESSSEFMKYMEHMYPKMFPSGNSESNAIYECQTSPVYTDNPLDVLLLGEVTRRCIPEYVVGGSDIASASAHCHLVNLAYRMEHDHIEALMIGLMPFLSLSWNRKRAHKYYFRASVTGTGGASKYARFYYSNCGAEIYGYEERRTWLKDQTCRHDAPSVEIRANENSILWVYFITSLLTSEDMIEKLTEILEGKHLSSITSKVMDSYGSLDIYSDLCIEIRDLVVPFLLGNMAGILEQMPETTREFMEEVLVAYLTEDEDEYNALFQTLLDSDAGIAAMFDGIDAKILKGSFEAMEGLAWEK